MTSTKRTHPEFVHRPRFGYYQYEFGLSVRVGGIPVQGARRGSKNGPDSFEPLLSLAVETAFNKQPMVVVRCGFALRSVAEVRPSAERGLLPIRTPGIRIRTWFHEDQRRFACRAYHDRRDLLAG